MGTPHKKKKVPSPCPIQNDLTPEYLKTLDVYPRTHLYGTRNGNAIPPIPYRKTHTWIVFPLILLTSGTKLTLIWANQHRSVFSNLIFLKLSANQWGAFNIHQPTNEEHLQYSSPNQWGAFNIHQPTNEEPSIFINQPMRSIFNIHHPTNEEPSIFINQPMRSLQYSSPNQWGASSIFITQPMRSIFNIHHPTNEEPSIFINQPIRSIFNIHHPTNEEPSIFIIQPMRIIFNIHHPTNYYYYWNLFQTRERFTYKYNMVEYNYVVHKQSRSWSISVLLKFSSCNFSRLTLIISSTIFIRHSSSGLPASWYFISIIAFMLIESMLLTFCCSIIFLRLFPVIDFKGL